MLRTIGKLIAAAVAVAATTYLGNKFLHWAGMITPKPVANDDDTFKDFLKSLSGEL